MKQLPASYYIGLMSGTSMDAIDAALVSIQDDDFQIRAYRECPYPAELHASLESIISPDTLVRPSTIGKLHTAIGTVFAEAASTLLREERLSAPEITAIGSHGQTIAHGPGDDPPFTLQLGDPSTIAYLTGITTVADFRSMDIAAGGLGAPLVPLFHAFYFGHCAETLAVVNIGGIANITILPARADTPLIAFDTGPGNTLLDRWCQLHHNEPYDRGGGWAGSGSVDQSLLDLLRSDPYFHRAPPKSTGREYFNLDWLEHYRQQTSMSSANPADTQATLLALTAHSIADAIRRFSPGCARVLVCGGGAKNSRLTTALQDRLAVPVASTATEKMAPEAVEAAAFAWLAARRLAGRSGNLPVATGAREPVILGGIYEPMRYNHRK